VTNAPQSRLSLSQAIQAYRDEWLVERDCARLKGRPLPLRPVWLSRDDHAVGLTRLLTLAARVLALAEYQVRRKLADEQRSLDHLYAGQPTRRKAVPTTECLLKAFDHIVFTLVQFSFLPLNVSMLLIACNPRAYESPRAEFRPDHVFKTGCA
jgi:transposase